MIKGINPLICLCLPRMDISVLVYSSTQME